MCMEPGQGNRGLTFILAPYTCQVNELNANKMNHCAKLYRVHRMAGSRGHYSTKAGSEVKIMKDDMMVWPVGEDDRTKKH